MDDVDETPVGKSAKFMSFVFGRTQPFEVPFTIIQP
jgi:hypothetical protein